MGNFLLLFCVCFHLVYLVLLSCFNIGRIITGVVGKLLLQSEIHDIRANGVHEILRMGGDDEDMVISRKVSFQPNDGAEVQMISRFIEEE